MRSPRLKTYLLVSLTLATAAPLICLGAVEVGRWRESQRRDTDKELAFTAEALARSMGQSVDANVRALETSAGELEAHQRLDPTILQRIVEIHRTRFPGLAVINIAGEDGRTIASDPVSDSKRGSYIGRDYRDREYYRQMIRTGRTGISEVEIGKISGQPAIHAKTPIRALSGPRAGQIIGDMGFALALDHLQRVTGEAVRSFPETEARVIDSRMRVITESDPHGRAVLRDLSGFAAYRPAIGAAISLRDGVDERGVPVRVAVARVSEQNLNWTVAVTRSRAKIEERAAHARRTVLIALMAALVAGLLMAVMLSSWLARPIASLETYAARVGAGERAQAPPSGKFNPREVTTLIDAVQSMVTELRARNQELVALQQTLEERIRDRTAEINQRTTEMRLLLDNLAEGIFTMDRQGCIGSEHSRILATWFGRPRASEPFFEYIGRCSPTFGKHAELGWEQVVDDILGLEVALGQLPKHLEAAGRHYSFSYRAIGDGESPGSRFLVVVSNVTPEIERETMLREKRETLALFEQVLGDRAAFLTFMDEAASIVSRALRATTPDDSLRRDLHTLKGNSLSFGIESVGSLCHEIETAMHEGGASWRDELVRLGERWTRLTSDVDRLLGQRRRVIEVSPEQHAEIERAGREGAPRDVLLRLFHDLTLDPIERPLRRLANQAHQMAARLDKQAVVELAHDDLRLEPAVWAPLWAAFVHPLRNAIDHGIEPPAERLAAGKSRAGRITLRARRDSGSVVVEIEDDGRGIDWEVLLRRGAARGLPVATEGDLLEVLFADGVSTARNVTQISGRGVGMGALRDAVRDLGGTIAVRSTRGLGTRVSMRFPTAAAGTATGVETV